MSARTVSSLWFASEFSDTVELEKDNDASMRTHIFYCDPIASCQKGSLENSFAIRAVARFMYSP